MTEPGPVLAQACLGQLPPLWPDDELRAEIRRRRESTGACVVAFDDDPTGTQTVAGVQVLSRPKVEDLRLALQSGDSALYLLTNSRSLPREDAVSFVQSLSADLAAAAYCVGRPLLIVSRSHSTLRGHFPAETDALSEGLGGQHPVLLIPFFAEGGRFTIDDRHWVREGDYLVPAAQTAFARDPVFGYQHSWLPGWVEEKTGGRVPASDVASLPIMAIRREGPQAARRWLEDLRPGQVGVVNAAHDRDLEVLAVAVHSLGSSGLLFPSAASWVKILAGLPDPSLVSPSDLVAAGAGGGLTVVGSVVPRTDSQLAALRLVHGLAWIELVTALVLEAKTRRPEIDRVAEAVQDAWARGQDALVYTSRAATAPTDLQAGRQASAALVEVVRALPAAPRYLVAKGGITASDLATEALGMRSARVLGPILPGVPVWQMGTETRWPGLPLIVFPGNVGEADALARLVEGLRL